ncbi:hypothetical protein [Aureispira sp. CCB-E]|uniref:hypothetical protein n=1 Tax=Aureispira sp. CCB-E TaxID=3051121 RepID=UPI002868ACA8|nr:hypothetical protein [Aureispira sp. CCB-E]WMX14374.1 hypothetical protein QP953_26315 [Aureispira sp. CCB-E]
MEHTNILDSELKENISSCGNRALWCLGGSLFCLWLTSLSLDYIEEQTLSTTLEGILIGTPLGMMGILNWIGCYWGIKGVRLKESQQWKSVLGGLMNLLLTLFIVLGVLLAMGHSQDIEPEELNVVESVEME